MAEGVQDNFPKKSPVVERVDKLEQEKAHYQELRKAKNLEAIQDLYGRFHNVIPSKKNPYGSKFALFFTEDLLMMKFKDMLGSFDRGRKASDRRQTVNEYSQLFLNQRPEEFIDTMKNAASEMGIKWEELVAKNQAVIDNLRAPMDVNVPSSIEDYPSDGTFFRFYDAAMPVYFKMREKGYTWRDLS